MSKEGKGRVVAVGNAKTRYVTVPSNVASDDRFPFTDGEEILVTIQADKKSLTISKIQ